MSRKILLFIIAAIMIASTIAHAQSSDWFETRHAKLTISCLEGLSYDTHRIYCNKATNMTDGTLQDVTVSWNMVSKIHHQGVTLWNDQAVKELSSSK
ncbi:MAG: hypothetical protein Q8R40_03275 [bacterium]|nr:hypothetical protein [bacterium]